MTVCHCYLSNQGGMGGKHGGGDDSVEASAWALVTEELGRGKRRVVAGHHG